LDSLKEAEFFCQHRPLALGISHPFAKVQQEKPVHLQGTDYFT
jgi:hypothetical protein